MVAMERGVAMERRCGHGKGVGDKDLMINQVYF